MGTNYICPSVVAAPPSFFFSLFLDGGSTICTSQLVGAREYREILIVSIDCWINCGGLHEKRMKHPHQRKVVGHVWAWSNRVMYVYMFFTKYTQVVS